MKEGWKYVKLEDIATNMFRGSGIKRDQVTSEGYPCIRYGEIYTTYNIAFEKCMSHTIESIIPSPKYIEPGDILFAITGESVEEIGKSIAYVGKSKCLVGGDIAVMQHKQNPKYLAYALSSPNAVMQKGLGKTKLKVVHTNIPSLKEIKIPLPSLSEQQRIVTFLDTEFAKIDALKAKAEQSLQNAKALFQAALKEMMEPKEGWNSKSLKEITTKIGSGATPKGGKNVYIEKGCSQIRSLNVHNNCFKYENLAHITEEAAFALKGVAIQKEDVLFNITGASIARCCVVPEDILPARVNQHVSIIRCKDEVVPQFLCFTLICPQHQKTLLGIGEAGSTRQAITKTDLETHVVSFPDVSDQKEIISKISKYNQIVQHLQSNYTRTLQLCADLKQSLLKQVFE